MQTGMPVQRSLALEHTHDDRIYDEHYQNQYLFGPFMLVAPSESTRELTRVYLPKGEWYYFFNGEVFGGKQEIIAESPVKRLPVYVKGGAIIPMQLSLSSTSEEPQGPLELHIYQGKEATDFLYYEDDGATYAYENGNAYQRSIAYLPQERAIYLDAKSGRAASAFSEIKLVLHGFNSMNRIDVNGKVMQMEEEEITFLTPISAFDPQGEEEVISGEIVSSVQFTNLDEEITIKW
jgi:alpha-glucosidase